jgi:anaerobic magnesium-protoporphyrin IX monomethyl ester cyclase
MQNRWHRSLCAGTWGPHMKITFIHPPLDDPTLPYHATAYLKGNLAKNGFPDVSMRDVNVEFVNYCLDEHNVIAFQEEFRCSLDRLSGRPELAFLEELELLELYKTGETVSPDALAEATACLRNKETFLDYPAYVKSVRLINQYFSRLGALCFPATFRNFEQSSRINYSIYNLGDLLNRELADRACRCFARYFHERLSHDEEFQQTDCFGISIPYDHQLMHAMWLARALKERWPEKQVLLGGTSISQCYKYLIDKSMLKLFFNSCDAIVIGEGETAVCEIAASGGDLHKQDIPNLVTYDRQRDELKVPERIFYESVPALGAPVYEYRWDLYLSPERGINYSPTRGCYWNRCTFCDYGLNTDTPTSPWRERKIDQVIADLRQTVEREEVKYVYFAVDVMAPAYLERLSDAMLEANLDLRWSAELRMEKIFSPDRCRKMARAGCVCASFGMESGNQRILDLIDKGTKVFYMAETMKNFSSAGIAVQLMTFTDFPTETALEKNATIDFIEDTRPYWSAGGIGTFVLTGTAMIARNPERFGIKVRKTLNADIGRCLDYEIEEGKGQERIAEEGDYSFDDTRGIFPATLGRPWAGGTDTLHSMIYYSRYSPSFFKEHDLNVHSRENDGPVNREKCEVELTSRFVHSRFDLDHILCNKKSYRQHAKKLLQLPSLTTFAEVLKWQGPESSVSQEKEGSYYLLNDRKCMKVEKDVYDLLLRAQSSHLSLGQLLAPFTGDEKLRMQVYVESLLTSGLLHLRPNKADLAAHTIQAEAA